MKSTGSMSVSTDGERYGLRDAAIAIEPKAASAVRPLMNIGIQEHRTDACACRQWDVALSEGLKVVREAKRRRLQPKALFVFDVS